MKYHYQAGSPIVHGNFQYDTTVKDSGLPEPKPPVHQVRMENTALRGLLLHEVERRRAAERRVRVLTWLMGVLAGLLIVNAVGLLVVR